MTEGNRWLLCEKLAQGLVMHASRIDDFAVGVALAGRMDWPAARLLALRQEEDALAEAAQLQTMVTDMSCESVERLQGWRRVVGADGELQAARIILARSGRSTAWWSEQHRKSFDLAVATVAEIAASAARSTR